MKKQTLNFKSIYLFLIFQLLVVFNSFGQDKKICEEFVETLVEGINQQSLDKISPWLSEEFEFLNQKQPLASKVLNALLKQKNDNILNYTEVGSKINDGRLEISYNFKYEKAGKTPTVITFDKNNKIVKLELVKAKVKIYGKSDVPKVNIPKQDVVLIPMDIKNNLILLNVTVNGEKQKFIFDSGAPFNILNNKYYKNNDSKTNISANGGGITGNNLSGADIVTINSLKLAHLSVQDAKMVTADLTKLGNDLNEEIHGIIGMSMVDSFDILLDYKHHQLILIKPEKLDTHIQLDNFTQIPFIGMAGHLPVVSQKIKATPYNVAIDCGATVNTMDISELEKLKTEVSKLRKENVNGFSMQSKETYAGKIKKCYLGDRCFKRQANVFMDLTHLNEGQEKIAIEGIIGYEVLSKQRSIISLSRQALFLEK